MARWPANLPNVAAGLAMSVALLLGGCCSPDKVNIQLRKDKQAMGAEIDLLKTQRDADRARIAALEKRATTVPVLPQAALDRMFTAHSLEIGRLTGGRDTDGKSAGDDVLKVYVAPLDETGEAIKATGKVVIEAFDLARQGEQRIGRWEFGVEESRQAWYKLGLSAFVFTCPWQTRPEHSQITVKVVFTDELTARELSAQTVVEVKLTD